MQNKRSRENRARKKKEERQTIIDNCVIDKTPPGANYSVTGAVMRTCIQISDDPSFLDRLRYGS